MVGGGGYHLRHLPRHWQAHPASLRQMDSCWTTWPSNPFTAPSSPTPSPSSLPLEPILPSISRSCTRLRRQSSTRLVLGIIFHDSFSLRPFLLCFSHHFKLSQRQMLSLIRIWLSTFLPLSLLPSLIPVFPLTTI